MPNPSHAVRGRALQPAFDLAQEQVARGEAPFVILGVADAAGLIRLETVSPPGGPRMATNAVCLLASITKPIVATAVLQQVEAGRIDLAGQLGDWAPGLVNPTWAPITAWHVLTHTSGLAEVDLEAVIRGGEDRAALLRRVAAGPQVSAPGSRFHYASDPFDLLAEAIAARTGEPFEDALSRTLLEPLAMTDTTFDPRTDPRLRGRTASLAIGDLEGRPLPDDAALVERYTRLHLHGGGLWSTASDLLRFGRAMLCRGELDGVRVLSPAFVDLMTREVTVARDAGGQGGLGWHEDPMLANHYALGWGRPGVQSVGSASAFGHGGVSGTRLWIDPAYDLVFVYLSGSWGLPVAPINAVQHAVYAALS